MSIAVRIVNINLKLSFILGGKKKSPALDVEAPTFKKNYPLLELEVEAVV